jgi:transcriptional regulator with XRE-family HTH domain
MEQLAHWTQRSVADFVYNISSNFVAQLETRMEEKEISRSELAARLNKSNGRVSQVFNNPGNLSLRVIVEFARTLGMKVGIVAYDDGDPANENGPINPEVFVESWEMAKRPRDLFDLVEVDAKQAVMNYIRVNTRVNVANVGHQLISPGRVVRGNTPPAVAFFNEQREAWTKGSFLPNNQQYHAAPIPPRNQTYS